MSTIAVGDEVALPQGHRAILRWIGRIPGRAPVEYAGVEVLGPDAERLGKHSGAYEGQQFFETSRPGTGLFVSYTQLVGANVRSARVETPRAARAVAVMSPAAYDAISPSPRYHKPPLLRAQAAAAPAPPADAAGSADTPSMAGQLEQLRAECERLRAARAAERKAFESKRADFRETLRVVHERLEQYAAEHAARVAEIRDEYEDRLRSARRSSSLVASAGGSEVQEQRLALAAMQNKLVSERAEKQQEIDRLKRELAHVRQVTGGADDLEALVADLSSMEQQLKDMRSKVDEMDALQRELESTRSRNAELELAVQARPRESAPSRPAADTVSRDEFARLEQALELRLLRESELEAQNEQLQAELAQLRAQAESASRAPARAERSAAASPPLADLSISAESAPPARSPPRTASPASLANGTLNGTANPANGHANGHANDYANDYANGHASGHANGHANDYANGYAGSPPTQAPPAPAPALADSWDLTTDADLPAAKPVQPAAGSPPAIADESNTSQFADLAAGRKDWCSLCERQGHSAIDCPFI